ncbi:BREX-2 system phosphatase PglZ [Spirillospora sp. NPDC048824]|uniref:BREX-2 system phosphatase PglZ n=1 Tax=Spirillospora sp. NPDC048824 TaxID=3364526 RepID=UPI003716980D
MSTPPLIDRRVLEALLDIELPRRGAGDTARLVVVHGRYRDGAPAEFGIRFGERQRRVRVSDQTSVLGIVDAWERHTAGTGDGSDAILVITTGVDDHQLGADLRAHALGRRALSVDRAEIVKQRFGAADLDPRIRQEPWLIDALLDAEPADGWRVHPAGEPWRRSGGSVLTRDTAVRALVGARLEPSGALPGGGDASGYRDLDVDSLLAWSRVPGAALRFAELAADERAGITAWLRRYVGDAAAVLLALVESGKGEDAMALGVVASVLTDAARTPDAALAIGGLFAGVTHDTADLRAFASAVQGTLARWIGEAGSERRGHETARERVMAVLDRADDLARAAGLGQAAAEHPFLPSGLDGRLRAFASALTESPRAAGEALNAVLDHRLAELFADRCGVAVMAARLRRWLDAPGSSGVGPSVVGSVAGGVAGQMRDGGWVDRALTVLWGGDPGNDPVLGRAYRDTYESAVRRRASLDEAFAARLEDWAAAAAAEAPGGALLAESVLEEIVLPLAREAAPLVLVLDGMSASVAAQLGEELARGGRWLEITAVPGARRGAVSMIPSVTRVSRASLLCGAATSGGQTSESAGFADFWKRRRREAALFHKAAIAGGPGQRLAQPLLDALAGDAVVGAVLNTIDDALDHDREGDRTGWRTSDITFLTDLLNAARDYKRPVVLVSDHGHVLERGGREPAPAPDAGSARWRTGEPGDGEIELAGPRVLEGGGRVVVPWREDIRYTPRKAGYHGGASLAEMTVPVLVFIPSADLVPKGWSILPPEQTVPRWWTGRDEPETAAPEPPARAVPRPGTRTAPTQKEALFTVGEAATAPAAPAAPDTLGTRVTRSPVYAGQRKYLRKAPDGRQVAAIIDALADAGGRLSSAAVGAAAAAAGGRAPRNADLFITALQRLLNVEGYPVLGLIDSGATVTLETALLREQFGVDE